MTDASLEVCADVTSSFESFGGSKALYREDEYNFNSDERMSNLKQ